MYRIQASWLQWQAATGVLCDRKFPIRLKGKFYRVAIRLALLYGTECWPVKKFHEQKMEVAEMRMQRWMCCNTIIDRIKNQEFREKLGVSPLAAKMRENRLRWFGHVQKKDFDSPVRRVESIISSFAGLLLFEGKTDRFPLVLPVKGVRVGLSVNFPHPNLTSQRDIRYDDDE